MRWCPQPGDWRVLPCGAQRRTHQPMQSWPALDLHLIISGRDPTC